MFGMSTMEGARLQHRGWPACRVGLAGVMILGGTILGACGDATGGEDRTQVAEVQVAPDTVRFDRVQASASLTATARSADGTLLQRRFNWVSSDRAVASVDATGSLNEFATVLGLSNGTATLTATADGVPGGVTVVVRQTEAGLDFMVPPASALVGQDGGPVLVSVTDPGGSVVLDAAGTVSLDSDPTSPGGLVGGPRSAALVNGTATFSDIFVDGDGFDYRLTAAWEAFQTTSPPFDRVFAYDRLTLLGAGAGAAAGAVVTVDANVSGGPINDAGAIFNGSSAEVGVLRGPASGAQAVVYAPGHRTAIARPSWTAGVDTAEVSLEGPVPLHATIWIVTGPFDTQRDRALASVERTRLIWANEAAGLVLDSIEVVDATEDPQAAGLARLTLCNSKADLEAGIGKQEGRINIYYVETVDGGTDRGRACSFGEDHIIMASRSGHELLAHEIGHLLSLRHIDTFTSEFDRTNVMHSSSSQRQYLTEAQIFRQQFNTGSALNAVFDQRSDETVNCSRDAVSGTCPAIRLRLKPDGSFQPNYTPLVPGGAVAESSLPMVLAGAHLRAVVSDFGAVGDVVAAWTTTSCEMEDNEGLSDRLRAGGQPAVIALERLAREAPADGVRLNALDGLALIGSPEAEERLTRLEAAFQSTETELASHARAARDRLRAGRLAPAN